MTQEVLPAIRTTGRYEAEPTARPFHDPVMPDEFETLRTKLALAKEARVVFGMRAARAAWRALDLLPAMTDQIAAEEERDGAIPVGVLAHLPRSITDWLAARTEAVTGHRVRSVHLYGDYIDWCRGNDVPDAETKTLRAFCLALEQIGVPARKDGGGLRFRVGLKLKE